jgi:hypothetical protein
MKCPLLFPLIGRAIKGTVLLGVQEGPNALRDDSQGHRLKARAAEPSMVSKVLGIFTASGRLALAVSGRNECESRQGDDESGKRRCSPLDRGTHEGAPIRV